MPWRPAKITQLPKEAAHVVNQLFRETNGRIDDIINTPIKNQIPLSLSLPKGLKVSPYPNPTPITLIEKHQTRITFSAINANQCQEQTIPSPHATSNGAVTVSPQATLGSPHLSWSGWVSSPGVISVRVCNPTTGVITPSPVIWNALVHI
jgi:hypothetical protein